MCRTTPRPRQARLRWGLLEPMAWCALALAATTVQLPQERLPRLDNDSFQYLSAANYLRSTQRMATSLVYFETERSHATIPAPLTSFPPGYPLAIALVSTLGFGYEKAALTISIGSFVVSAAGLWCLMRILEPSLWAARAAMVCWLTNSQALVFSVAAMSESLFTVFGLAILLFLVNAEQKSANNTNRISWIGAAVMAGASYWVRYAGVLWVLTYVTLLLIQTFGGRYSKTSARRSAIVAGTVLLSFLLPLMVRNVMLVGNWKGGNNLPAAMPISELVLVTPRIWLHLLLGNGTLSQLWFPIGLISTGLVGLIGTCLASIRCAPARLPALLRQAPSWRPSVTKRETILAAFLIYSIGIAAIAFRSTTEYSTRMYIPVLPHLIALLVCGVALLIRRLPAGNYSRPVSLVMILCLLLASTMGNFASGRVLQPDLYERTQQALLRPDDAGHSIKYLLDQELKPGEVIAATNGQAAGYVLQRPTVSLSLRRYSFMTWDEPALHADLARFGATHLLVFRDARFDPVLQESRFLVTLADGQVPSWLRLIGSNRSVYVYRVRLSTFTD
jgi:hypothetical protein